MNHRIGLSLTPRAGEATRTSRSSKLRSRAASLASLALSVLLLVATGCEPSDINREYGLRRNPQGQGSVNGTGVLGRMFEQAGHQVGTWKRLSPRMIEPASVLSAESWPLRASAMSIAAASPAIFRFAWCP